MNHLQVAAGSGEGNSYDFDIRVFADAFHLHAMQCNYVLQTLAQEGLLYISDAAFKPSQATFICNKEELRAAEENFPKCGEMIKTLLRTYAGIFDHATMIFENQLARLLKITAAEATAQLQFLHRIQVIQYIPQSDKPRITLLRNRMYKDDFKFDNESIRKRKEVHLKRIQSMIDYANKCSDCRSVNIARYFNDAATPPCGKCGNCKKLIKTPLTAKDFERIITTIDHQFQSQSFTQKELMEALKPLNSNQVLQAISFLMKERKIKSTDEGRWIRC